MTNSSAPNDAIPRSAWLAVAVGSLTALGLKTVLPVVVLFLTRGIALGTDSPGLWLEHADDASHLVWLALQAAIALGAGLGVRWQHSWRRGGPGRCRSPSSG